MSDTTANGRQKAPVEPDEFAPGFARYCGPVPFDELPIPEPPNAEDHAWALNDRELHRQYQGLVVAVCGRKVWGAGRDHQAARDDARKKPGCPAEDALAFVPMWGVPGGPEGGAERTKSA